ncbi:surface layer protein SlpC [Lentilactobacillus buchneri]|uniref:surface layer protein SlpC n=1 Tax=Lentilactobacillus buchneri TaxID=1581 RepID=UPI001291549E|nr:surface layer protein SlpC [Lentilactobacillus buchneri]MQM60213.1 surface layer protein SlpC [Lentilactobacillus buchneri]MQM79901.1 surface layer protein SlpC [Lentilactobacillus buchneri]
MKTITSKLILGLGLTLAIGAFTLTPTNTEAKSTTTVTSNQALVADGNSRNYLTTGTAPLYSKVPVYKSAKVVTKAAVLKTLGTTADAGQTYFRGYRAAQTSNGDWYLKVVSFDKTYRGWIFAGTTDPTINPSDVSGGLKATTTFQESTVPTYFANTTMYFTTPKASTLTYVAPDYTQYKVGRNLSATADFYKDPLTVTKVGTKQNNRDGNATYYYVTYAAHPQVNGWVKQSDVTTSR